MSRGLYATLPPVTRLRQNLLSSILLFSFSPAVEAVRLSYAAPMAWTAPGPEGHRHRSDMRKLVTFLSVFFRQADDSAAQTTATGKTAQRYYSRRTEERLAGMRHRCAFSAATVRLQRNSRGRSVAGLLLMTFIIYSASSSRSRPSPRSSS